MSFEIRFDWPGRWKYMWMYMRYPTVTLFDKYIDVPWIHCFQFFTRRSTLRVAMCMWLLTLCLLGATFFILQSRASISWSSKMNKTHSILHIPTVDTTTHPVRAHTCVHGLANTLINDENIKKNRMGPRDDFDFMANYTILMYCERQSEPVRECVCVWGKEERESEESALAGVRMHTNECYIAHHIIIIAIVVFALAVVVVIALITSHWPSSFSASNPYFHTFLSDKCHSLFMSPLKEQNRFIAPIFTAIHRSFT